MMGKLKNTGLIGLGVVAGVAVSLQFSAMAQKTVEPPLPLAELRQLADYVIGRYYPECRSAANPYARLLQLVSERTAALLAQW